MTVWRRDSVEREQEQSRFYRVMSLASWTLATALVVLPIVWLVLVIGYGDEDHAVIAIVISPMIGVIGHVLSMTLIKRWSV